MAASAEKQEWPPIPGDFEVKNPSSCVAICTLGKKIEVNSDYAIIGTCKTENIGIERMIVNIVSNPSIRYFVLAGPEVPGHKTGSSVRCLHQKGVDKETRKISEADGAIPYVENLPIEAIERFRSQVELIDMIDVTEPEKIGRVARELASKNPGPYSAEALWVEFKAKRGSAAPRGLGSSIALLPEYGLSVDPFTSLVSKLDLYAIVTSHPSTIAIVVQRTDTGTILVGKEL
jgi:tetrahydromethanopterin S-methyltransferase subunit A